jgi:hypothetical protein
MMLIGVAYHPRADGPDKQKLLTLTVGCPRVRFLNLGLGVDFSSHSSTSIQIDQLHSGVHLLTLSSRIGP